VIKRPLVIKLNLFSFRQLLCTGLSLVCAPTLYAQISFELSSSPMVGSNPRSIVAADVNGDGAPDLVTANQNSLSGNTVTVLTNKGKGEFWGASTLRAESQPYSIAAGDFTGNGTIDLVCANYGANTITAFGGDGLANFGAVITAPVGTRPKSVVLSDVNLDGRLDLICANSSSANLSVLPNLGAPYYFLNVASAPATGTGPACVRAADLNGDTWPDLVVANITDVRAFTILTNDRSGAFVAAPAPSSTFFHSAWITTADLTGSGQNDIVCLGSAASANAISVFTNNGSGTFSIACTAETGLNPYGVIAVDLDANKTLELVTANQGNNTLTIFTNAGGASFSPALTVAVGSGPESITSADVNVDGKPDLITANWNNATLTVMTNSTIQPPPALSICKTASDVRVSWPSPSSGWILQQAEEAGASEWSTCEGVLDEGTTKSLIATGAPASRYFRLWHP
jgi:hypothetical protein